MPAYDQLWFDPPAPLAMVTLRNLMTGATVAGVPMLLDTGADVTLLPQGAVERLGVTMEISTFELTGFDGNKSMAPSVEAEVVLFAKNFKGQFLVIRQDYGILGRNILNNIYLILDGPDLEWRENK